jgi:hypothetical protein
LRKPEKGLKPFLEVKERFPDKGIQNQKEGTTQKRQTRMKKE